MPNFWGEITTFTITWSISSTHFYLSRSLTLQWFSVYQGLLRHLATVWSAYWPSMRSPNFSLWSLQTGESMAWLPSVSLENKKNNGNKGLEHTVPRWARVTQFEVQILGGSTSSFQCVVTATPSSDFTRDKVVVTDKKQLNWVCLATKTLKCWYPQTNMAMENQQFSIAKCNKLPEGSFFYHTISEIVVSENVGSPSQHGFQY